MRYTATDWQALRTEQAGIHQRLLDAMRAGTPATDPAVMDLAEEHRRHLDRWLHDCPPRVHRTLAAAYLANERIGRNYDDMAPGLSRYVHDAIVANCERAEKKQACMLEMGIGPVPSLTPWWTLLRWLLISAMRVPR